MMAAGKLGQFLKQLPDETLRGLVGKAMTGGKEMGRQAVSRGRELAGEYPNAAMGLAGAGGIGLGGLLSGDDESEEERRARELLEAILASGRGGY